MMNAPALPDNAPAAGSLWVHYKGNAYIVVRSALIESDLSPCVVYERATLLASGVLPPLPTTFVRPLAEWTELVQHEGETVPRFRPLAPAKLEGRQ